jgi:hypothetical protein
MNVAEDVLSMDGIVNEVHFVFMETRTKTGEGVARK